MIQEDGQAGRKRRKRSRKDVLSEASLNDEEGEPQK